MIFMLGGLWAAIFDVLDLACEKGNMCSRGQN